MAGVSSAFGNVTVFNADGSVAFSNSAGQSFGAPTPTAGLISRPSLPPTLRGTTTSVASILPGVRPSDAEVQAEFARLLGTTVLGGGAVGALAVGGAAAGAVGTAAGGALSLKTAAEIGLGVMATATFGNFIFEEAVQAASFGVSTAINAKDAKAARVALEKYVGFVEASRNFLDGAGQAGLVTEPAFRAFNDASRAAAANFATRINALERAGDAKALREAAAALKRQDANTIARMKIALQLGNRGLALNLSELLATAETREQAQLVIAKYDATVRAKLDKERKRAEAAQLSAQRQMMRGADAARNATERAALVSKNTAARAAKAAAKQAALEASRVARAGIAEARRTKAAADAAARAQARSQSAAQRNAREAEKIRAELEAQQIKARARLKLLGF